MGIWETRIWAGRAIEFAIDWDGSLLAELKALVPSMAHSTIRARAEGKFKGRDLHFLPLEGFLWREELGRCKSPVLEALSLDPF